MFKEKKSDVKEYYCMIPLYELQMQAKLIYGDRNQLL